MDELVARAWQDLDLLIFDEELKRAPVSDSRGMSSLIIKQFEALNLEQQKMVLRTVWPTTFCVKARGEAFSEEIRRRKSRRMSNSGPGLVYYIEAKGSGAVKIGWTGRETKWRLQDLQCGCPFPLVLLGEEPGTQDDEYDIRQNFISVHGEWVELTLDLKQWILDIPERIEQEKRRIRQLVKK